MNIFVFTVKSNVLIVDQARKRTRANNIETPCAPFILSKGLFLSLLCVLWTINYTIVSSAPNLIHSLFQNKNGSSCCVEVYRIFRFMPDIRYPEIPVPVRQILVVPYSMRQKKCCYYAYVEFPVSRKCPIRAGYAGYPAFG